MWRAHMLPGVNSDGTHGEGDFLMKYKFQFLYFLVICYILSEFSPFLVFLSVTKFLFFLPFWSPPKFRAKNWTSPKSLKIRSFSRPFFHLKRISKTWNIVVLVLNPEISLIFFLLSFSSFSLDFMHVNTRSFLRSFQFLSDIAKKVIIVYFGSLSYLFPMLFFNMKILTTKAYFLLVLTWLLLDFSFFFLIFFRVKSALWQFHKLQKYLMACPDNQGKSQEIYNDFSW